MCKSAVKLKWIMESVISRFNFSLIYMRGSCTALSSAKETAVSVICLASRNSRNCCTLSTALAISFNDNNDNV